MNKKLTIRQDWLTGWEEVISTEQGASQTIGDVLARLLRSGLANRNKKGLLLRASTTNGFFEDIVLSLGELVGELLNGLFDSGTIFFSMSPLTDC